MGFWNSVKDTFKGFGEHLKSGAQKVGDTLENFFSPNDGSADFLTGLQNQFTGNLDYQRQLELMAKTQEFNAMEAQKQRDFEERMSNSQYQRAIQDLKAAGLNPALVMSNGGASVPTGSSASSSIPAAGHSGQAFGLLLGVLTKGVLSSISDKNRIAMTALENQGKEIQGKNLKLKQDIAETYLERSQYEYLRSLRRRK